MDDAPEFSALDKGAELEFSAQHDAGCAAHRDAQPLRAFLPPGLHFSASAHLYTLFREIGSLRGTVAMRRDPGCDGAIAGSAHGIFGDALAWGKCPNPEARRRGGPHVREDGQACGPDAVADPVDPPEIGAKRGERLRVAQFEE